MIFFSEVERSLLLGNIIIRTSVAKSVSGDVFGLNKKSCVGTSNPQ
ncbi:MAG: hypothetical protein F6K54_08785 [Okeania sp. SIO3B5]|nr:hypothetical protein [Okeania sp. SIO3B5]NEO53167.1 hypothetical protein [Okeania sp. SIO3B5]